MCQNDKEQIQDLAQQLAEAQAHLQRIGAEKAAIEARFRMLAGTTSAAIFIVEGMRILYANDAAQFVTGYSRDELLNMELWQFAHPTYQQVLKQNGLKQPWAEDVPNRFELRIVTRAGEERWWDVTTGSIEYDGKPAFVVTAFDITERDRAEKALQKAKEELEVRVAQRTADLREANEQLREQAEELKAAAEELSSQNDKLRSAQHTIESERQRYQELFDFAPGGYLVTDEHGIICEANRAAAEMLNVHVDRLVSKPLTVYVAEQEHQTLYAQLAQLQQGQEIRQWEMRLQPREGTPFPALIDVVPMRDVQGQLVGFRWLLRDITERKQAEKEIASLAKFPSENPNPILRLAPDGIVLYANEASAALLQEWSCAVGGYAPEFWRNLIAEAFTNGLRRTIDIECKGRVYSFVVVPITEAGYVNLYGRDITERKRAEEALKAERNFASTILDTVGALVVVLDKQGRIVRFNRACEQTTGYSFDEVQDQHFWNRFLIPEEMEPVQAVFAELRAGQFPQQHENYWVTRDGSRRLIDWKNTALLDSAGSVEYVIGTGIDITERKQMEEALHESEERARDQAARLQAVLDAAPAIIWTAHDRKCRTITGNRASQELLRVPEGTNVSKSGPAPERLAHYRVFKDGVELEPQDMPIQQVAASGQGFSNYPMEIVFDDGTLRSLLGNVTPLFDAKGQPNGAIAAFMDITERRRAEETLRESEEQLKRAQEIAHLGSWELDLVNNRLTWSDEVYRIFGLQPQEFGVTYEAFLEVVHPDDRTAVDAAYSGSLREGRDTYEIEHRVVRKASGEVRVVHEKCEHVRDAAGQIIRSVGMVHDITERKQMEEALRKSEEHARDQAARLQAVLDAAPAIIWTAHDRECQTITGNRASQELLRVPEGTNVSKSGPAPERLAHYRVFKDGVELEPQDMPIQRVAASGQGFSNYAMEIVFDDGAVRSLLGNVTPVLDSAGQPNGAIAAFMDITERKRAEEERERLLEENSQQRRLLETLFEADPDGLAVVIGNELVVQLANPAYQAFTPHPTENPVGQGWDQVWAGAVAPEVASAIHRVMVSGEPADEESQKRVFADGQTHYFSFHARRLRWNTEYAALIVLQETTAIEEARLRASQAAQEAQRRAAELDAIITSIADGVMIHDMASNIVRMNPAAERIMGYSPEERKLSLAERTTKVIQLTWSDGQPLTDVRDLPVPRALHGEIVDSSVMRLHHSRSGKPVWVSISAAPIRTPDGAMLGAVSTLTDITELREAQQRLEQSNEQLQAQTEELEVQAEELQQMTQELVRARDELELRVQERTAELAQANVELRRASAYNRSLIEASLDPLVTIGPDGKINDVNAATELATGRSRQELVGADFAYYFTEPDKALAGYRQVFEKGLVRDYPLEIRHRDGHATPVLYNASVYKDEAGRVMGVFAAARDITERKRAEEAVKAERQRFNDVLEMLPAYLVLLSPDYHVPFANRFFRERFGESHGRRCFEYLFGRSQPCEVCETYKVLKTMSPLNWEWTGPDGRNYAVSDFPFTERDGSTLILEMGIDVTEQKRAQKALQLASAYNRSLIEAGLDPLVTIGPDGKINDVNAATERITGCARSELVSTDFSDYFTEPEKARAGYQQVFREGSVRDYALELRHRDGHVTSVLYNASIYRDEAGQVIGVFAAAHDITARKQAEAQLKRYNEELRALSSAERSQRLLAETLSAANLALTQTLSLETVMETLLDYVGRLVSYDSANVMLLEAESRLSVRAARGYERRADADQARAIAFDVQANPVFNELFTTRKSVLVPDTRTHPGWQVQPGAEHVHSWIGVPLMAGGNVIGVYSLDKTEPGFFTQEHVRQAEMLVGQAAVAIQNAWLFEQVRAGRERLQSLSRRLVEVQEAERHYVARELHDEVGQALTSLKFGLSQLEPEADLAQHAAQVAELKRMTDDVLESLHRLAMNLRPVSLDHLGLVPALEQYVRAIGDRYGLIAQFKAVDMSERLSPAVETALYRIVQEALTNAVRHAHATRVDVLLERRGDQVIVVVEDDGVGFDAQAASLAQSGHLGLVGMQERAEMLGGSLVIESAPGAGTTVVVEVPHVHSYPHR